MSRNRLSDVLPDYNPLLFRFWKSEYLNPGVNLLSPITPPADPPAAAPDLVVDARLAAALGGGDSDVLN